MCKSLVNIANQLSTLRTYLLLKSKYFVTGSSWEGHPKAIIEAMACGLICVAPSVNGINNLIEHGKTGILYDGTNQDLITKFFTCFF